MKIPKTFDELIDLTWPTRRDVYLVESYLSSVFAERGESWLDAPSQEHWIGASADIKRAVRRH